MNDALSEAPSSVVHYVHFPSLVVHGGRDLLGGHLMPFDFETFARLDGGWAEADRFQATQPTVWRCSDRLDEFTLDPGVDGLAMSIDRVRRRAALIYCAMLTTPHGIYPDPRLSVHYVQWPRAMHVSLGSYERTFLLNGVKRPPLPEATIADIDDRVTTWATHGLSSEARIFGPLRALAMIASGAISPAVSVLPLVVSLEGYLLGRRVTGGIAAALARQVRGLLGDIGDADIESVIRRVYAWRSDLVHGRPQRPEQTDALLILLSSLIRAVVRSGVDRAVAAGSDGNDLSVVRIG